MLLIEAREALGGALALWGQLPGRQACATAIGWWAGELARLGVEVRLGTRATADMVLAERPDAVIMATGAAHDRGGRSITLDADIPGHDLPHVFRPDELLLSGHRPGGRIVMADGEGYHASTGTAEILATAGAEERCKAGSRHCSPSAMPWPPEYSPRQPLKATSSPA